MVILAPKNTMTEVRSPGGIQQDLVFLMTASRCLLHQPKAAFHAIVRTSYKRNCPTFRAEAQVTTVTMTILCHSWGYFFRSERIARSVGCLRVWPPWQPNYLIYQTSNV